MRNRLVGNRGGEVVGKDLEGTTFPTITRFTNANCLYVLCNVYGGRSTAATATTARRASTGRTSSGWWGTTPATTGTGGGRRTRGHASRLVAGCGRGMSTN